MTRKLSHRLSTSIVLLVLAVLASGCSIMSSAPQGSYLQRELANKGPVRLNEKNPYFAANLFVTRELPENDIIKGFLRYRGNPDAVEVIETEGEPLKVALLYKDKKEFYLLTEKEEWLVDGPIPIPTRTLAAIEHKPIEPRKIEPIAAKTDELPPAQKPEESLAEPETTPEPFMTPPPQPTLTPESAFSPPPSGPKTPRVDKNSGDMIHRVRFRGETLRIIANWYTGDIWNAERLARINNIENANVLHLYQVVRIPRYMLKRIDPFSIEEITRYYDSLKR